MPHGSTLSRTILLTTLAAALTTPATAQRTQKPVLHGKDWMAITGKPLGATAGAMMFLKGGNAVDAAAAMLGATATMWDVLGWGGETQALIHNPETGEVIGINALGVAPTGATPEFFRERDMEIPPAYGPLAAVTPCPVLLQALNILEGLDVAAMGYNSTRYIHAVYQAMNLAFADRDFYYGDPYYPPEEPIAGLLSKDYAAARAAEIDWDRNNPDVLPGDPYPFQNGANPFLHLIETWNAEPVATPDVSEMSFEEAFHAGTTSIQAADADGWVVSVTPSGGWIPAVIAGRTGIGMSQRMQSFVLDERAGPYNVVEPGKRPRATLTPSLALKDGRPFLSFAVQGGDGQDQNLLQFFLNMVEFGMNVQQAAEAANFNSYQMRSSFGAHESQPGRLLLNDEVSAWVRAELREMAYDLTFSARTSGPINAIFFDPETETMWGGSSNHGEDHGIAW